MRISKKTKEEKKNPYKLTCKKKMNIKGCLNN